ncbi:MAG: transporter associated domain-containing protein, partial [bacterium]|nr:transporter associated domain-containing protein [bacterium]
IEELVGEIIDEKDVAPELIKRVSKNEFVVHGQTRIAYINQFFNTEIKSKKNVNGFLLEKLGEVPEEGVALEIGGVRFVAEAVRPRAIDRVRIIKNIEGSKTAA